MAGVQYLLFHNCLVFVGAELMAELGQGLDDHDVDGIPENTQPEQNQAQENDSIPVVSEKRWPGWPGESVFRMLVPTQKVGSIIGRKGEFIKKMCEETRARIKILDGPPGTAERAVSLFLFSLLLHFAVGNLSIAWQVRSE